MDYDSQRVATLIAACKDPNQDKESKDKYLKILEELIQPRLRHIVDAFGQINWKYIVEGQDTVENDVIQYITNGGYFGQINGKIKFNDPPSIQGFCDYQDRGGILLSYCNTIEDEDYPRSGDIIIPIDFLTCRCNDLRERIIWDIYDNQRRHLDNLRKELDKQNENHLVFLLEYSEEIKARED